MKDRLYIHGLRLETIIGTHEEERTEKQELLMDLELHCDLRPAGCSDRLEDTVDYEALQNALLQFAADAHFALLEAFAEEAAQIALRFPGVQAVVIHLRKTGALRHAAASGLTIYRNREEPNP